MNRLVVGAHYGLGDWLAQRITAVIMAVYFPFILIAALCTANYTAWVAFMSCTPVRAVSLVAFLSLAWHAWVGVRDIWMDYVKCVCLRLALHVLTLVFLTACIGWAVRVLWSL